jgi:hypothetical protein
MFSPPNTNLFRLGEVVKLKLAVNCRNEATWDFVKLETLLRPSTLLHQTQIKYSSRVLRRICTLQQRNTRFELNEKRKERKRENLLGHHRHIGQPYVAGNAMVSSHGHQIVYLDVTIPFSVLYDDALLHFRKTIFKSLLKRL